jgi:hypothetical protein
LVVGSSGGSVAAVTAGWGDGGERFEIEVGDGLEGLGGGTVAEGFGERLEPGDVVGLQGEEFFDGISPALRAGAAIGGTTISDEGLTLLVLVAGAVAGLALGVGEGVVALGFAASWHGLFSVT